MGINKNRGHILTPLILLGLVFIVSGCGSKSGVVKMQGAAPEQAEQLGKAGPQRASLADVLKELEELEAPEGVDAELFHALKEKLAIILKTGSEERANVRFISKPPTGEAGRVKDLALLENGDGGYVLSWSYVNAGDYNQDGIVNISDIFPLADHFFHKSSYGGEAPSDNLDDVIDGNLNGEVDIGDIFPLADNFFSQVVGYKVEGSNDGVSFSEVGEVGFSLAQGEGRKRFSFQLESLVYTRYRVIPVDSAGLRGEPSNVSLPPGLFPESLSKDSGHPGEWIEIFGSGWNENTQNLRLSFEGTTVPVIEQVEGTLGFYVPPLEPREYAVTLKSERYTSQPLLFTILPPENLPYSQSEFAQVMETGLTELARTVREIVLKADAFQDIGYTPEQTEALLTIVGEAEKIIGAACSQIAEMEPQEVERLQSLYFESGLLGQLVNFAEKQPSKLVSQYQEMHFALFIGDVVSFALTNLQPILSIAEVVVTAASVGTGGAASPALLFCMAVRIAIKIIDGVIDIFIPTDLQEIHFRDRRFRPGQSVWLDGIGYFSCEKNFAAGAISLTISVAVDIVCSALEVPVPDAIKNEIVQSISGLLIGAGVDITTNFAGQVFQAVGDKPLFDREQVALDMRIYEGGLIAFLSLAFPNVDFEGFLGKLEGWGLPVGAFNVVTVEASNIISYSRATGRVTGLAEGVSKLKGRGIRFKDESYLWGALTLCWPIYVWSNEATYTIDPNASTEPPNIHGVSPTFGLEGKSVTFTANVTGGQPMSFSWDFGGGASPNTSTLETPQVTLGTIRKYTVKLHVENEWGEDEYWFILTICREGNLPGWHIVPVVAEGLDAPAWIFSIEGKPAIIYSSDMKEIKLIRALDPEGTTWGESVHVVTVAHYGFNYYFTAALVNGYLAVAYNQPDNELPHLSNDDIMYVRALDVNGQSWGEPVAVVTEGETTSPSLTVVNGRPAIAFSSYDIVGGDTVYEVRILRANDPYGDSWGTPVTIGTYENLGQLPYGGKGLAIVSGKPAIISANLGLEQILFTRANDENGTSWSTPIVVADHAEGPLGIENAYGLEVVNGFPMVIYEITDHSSQYYLSFGKALDSLGESWTSPALFDKSTTWQWYWLAKVMGRPAIAYSWYSNEPPYGQLRMFWADDRYGNNWPAPLIINNVLPEFVSLFEVNGYPAIAYRNYSTGYLEYAYYRP